MSGDRASGIGDQVSGTGKTVPPGPRSPKPETRRRMPGPRYLMPLLFLLCFFLLPPLRLVLITPPPPMVSLPALTAAQGNTRYRIAIINWGYHSAIAVEQPVGWTLGPPGRETARYVEYSWGDRRFFKDRDRSAGNIFALVFLGTDTVVYLNGWDGLPNRENGAVAVHERTVTSAELVALLTSLEQSFARPDNAPRPTPFPLQDPTHGTFYPGREHYIGWYDCNAWAVARLHDAHLARPPWGTFFVGQVAGAVVGGQWSVVGGP